MKQKRPKPKYIHIHGRRWFQRTYGNTYHTVSIYVDGDFRVHTSMQYGYGDGYIQTAREWLVENGLLNGIEEHEPLWRYCERKKIKFLYEVTDVARERDL